MLNTYKKFVLTFFFFVLFSFLFFLCYFGGSIRFRSSYESEESSFICAIDPKRIFAAEAADCYGIVLRK